MILEVSWDSLWTLSFGLSQFHGHVSWLMCEVALRGLWNFSNLMKKNQQITSCKWVGLEKTKILTEGLITPATFGTICRHLELSCNSLKNGELASFSQGNPQQFYDWDWMHMLV